MKKHGRRTNLEGFTLVRMANLLQIVCGRFRQMPWRRLRVAGLWLASAVSALFLLAFFFPDNPIDRDELSGDPFRGLGDSVGREMVASDPWLFVMFGLSPLAAYCLLTYVLLPVFLRLGRWAWNAIPQ
jgi:hypothetical protein